MEWAKFQERERKKEEEEREKERVAYAQIDWHDFVVVETVDFQPNEQGRWKPIRFSTGSGVTHRTCKLRLKAQAAAIVALTYEGASVSDALIDSPPSKRKWLPL